MLDKKICLVAHQRIFQQRIFGRILGTNTNPHQHGTKWGICLRVVAMGG